MIMSQRNDDTGRNIAAFILIGIGLLFLAAQTFSFSFFGTLWPLLVILPGLAFLYPALTGDKGKAGLAVPGAMITGTGLILMYQNLTGHWQSWAYVWTLYPVFLGLALTFIGRRTDNESTLSSGNGFVKWGLIAFIGMWGLFELLIFGGRSTLVSVLVPLVLIGAGLYMLFQRSAITIGSAPKRKVAPPPSSPADINPELRRRIDEALSETDEREPHSN
jgi:hypothetical protein